MVRATRPALAIRPTQRKLRIGTKHHEYETTFCWVAVRADGCVALVETVMGAVLFVDIMFTRVNE